tara:strand:- start:103 stop:261 length:159 start_codon:yes stop_codon:yes gene_type:complete
MTLSSESKYDSAEIDKTIPVDAENRNKYVWLPIYGAAFDSNNVRNFIVNRKF